MQRLSFFSGVGLLAAAAGLATLGLHASPAQACGGFWCSQANPVNQSAEQIIFVDHGDDTVTAVIQIQYVGPAERFAWVVPIPGTPDIDVASNTVFSRLNQATSPRYELQVEVEGTCMEEDFLFDLAPTASGGFADAGVAEAERSAVMIEDQGSVGPFDYVVISLDPALSDPADVAIEWFVENGYDLSGTDSELLGPYLDDGLNLLAFRLTKGNEVGEIRPVILTYASALPMIPIRPTAVAAQNDMGIRVWVAAETQAIPKNYKSLVLNEALIDWINYASNYDEVVTAAANEAGGQGFVTELAGATSDYDDVIFSSTDGSAFDELRTRTYPNGVDAIWAANSYYRNWDGWREAIEAAVTLPAGVSFDDFGRNPDGYRDTAEVDVALFFQELEDNVVGPVEKTAELVNAQAYLTRMYSTMSAEEMTMDPLFDYNPDLADVSNLHMAKQIIHCSEDLYYYEAPWTIELPQGGVIEGDGNTYTWPITLDDQPANLKIVQLSTSGSGEVITDNASTIGEKLFEVARSAGSGDAMPDPPEEGVMIGGTQTVELPEGAMQGPGDEVAANASEGDGGWCSVGAVGASRGAGAASLCLVALGCLALRRRRRR